MTDREKLTALIMGGAVNTLNDGALNCTKLADYLLEHGVIVPTNNPKPLLKDGNPFNTDVYCPYCGTNLSGYYGDEPTSIIQCFNCGEFLDNTKSITREEAEQALKERK